MGIHFHRMVAFCRHTYYGLARFIPDPIAQRPKCSLLLCFECVVSSLCLGSSITNIVCKATVISIQLHRRALLATYKTCYSAICPVGCTYSLSMHHQMPFLGTYFQICFIVGFRISTTLVRSNSVCDITPALLYRCLQLYVPYQSHDRG